MLREEFVEAVVDEIKNIVGDNAEVRHNEIRKNNGLVLNGITIQMPGETVTPTVYIENFVDDEHAREDYIKGIHRIAKEIICTIAEHRNNPIITEFNVDKFMDFEYAKDNLHIRLVNYKANEEMLREMPYEKFLDLAIICCVNVVNNGVIKISNELLKTYGISKETLFEIAKENAPKLEPAVGANMEEIIFGLIGRPNKLGKFNLNSRMYVLSNKSGVYGAAIMLYNEVLDELASQVDSDLIVIPSSVHELILMPYENGMDIEAITEMIQDVNNTEVYLEEILSNHAYIYNRFTKQIEMPN